MAFSLIIMKKDDLKTPMQKTLFSIVYDPEWDIPELEFDHIKNNLLEYMDSSETKESALGYVKDKEYLSWYARVYDLTAHILGGYSDIEVGTLEPLVDDYESKVQSMIAENEGRDVSAVFDQSVRAFYKLIGKPNPFAEKKEYKGIEGLITSNSNRKK